MILNNARNEECLEIFNRFKCTLMKGKVVEVAGVSTKMLLICSIQ